MKKGVSYGWKKDRDNMEKQGAYDQDGGKEEQRERGMLSTVERPECRNTEPSTHEKMMMWEIQL